MGVIRQPAGRYTPTYVELHSLAAVWPELYEDLLEKLAEIEDLPDGRAGHDTRKNRKSPSKRSVSKRTRVKTDTTECEHVWDNPPQQGSFERVLMCVKCNALIDG